MVKITINQKYTTQEDIEQCIKAFNELSEEDRTLKIIFTENINEIDILLIGYLTLFKELKPNINIEIELKSPVSGDLKSKLFQYLIYAYLMTGERVFTIQTNATPHNERQRRFFIDENSPPRYFHQYFVLSKSFMPILLVGKRPDSTRTDWYDLLFKENLPGLDKLPEGVSFDKNNEQQYKNLNKWIKGYRDGPKWTKGVIDPKKRDECIRYLARLAFYNALQQAKIASFYFCDDEDKLKSLRLSTLSRSQEKQYPQVAFFKEIKGIFDELATRPPIYHFIYSQLLSSDLLPGEFNDSNKEKVKEILHALWDYTRDMVVGIKELAKNIREHADPPVGIITGRTYKEETWTELKTELKKEGGNGHTHPDQNTFFKNYLNTLKKEGGNGQQDTQFSFFDFNVIDLGKKDIIETLKEKTKTIANNETIDDSIRNLFKEDLNILEQNKIELMHFLDPSLGTSLNQQIKKSIAHLGLLIFSNLIAKNKGLLRAGSLNCTPFIKEYAGGSTNESAEPIPYGTNYHIVLPIGKKREIKPLLPHPMNVPLDSSLIEIKGMEELLHYELVNLACKKETASNNPEGKGKRLFRVCVENEYSTNQESKQKLWKCIHAIIKPQEEHLQESFVCIDFENVEINESQLFRFLGTWNLYYPDVSLIVTNIKVDTLKELIAVNDLFVDKVGFSSEANKVYWNENNVILIYSYHEEGKERFYFADILWGKEKQDFYRVNQLVRKTNFNATTILFSVADNNEQGNGDNRLAIIAQSGFFYSKTTLMPFDLLLPGQDARRSIFEHNASVLLQNELIPQRNHEENHGE